MARKIIGITLLVIGGILGTMLIAWTLAGGPIWPHIMGPTTLLAVGAVVLAFKRKAS